MAEEKELKRVYNVPLRREFLKTPKWKRTKKAVKALKEFLAKHMKADINNVLIGKNLNEHVWKNGIKNPPHHVKVEAIKDKEGIVKAELEGFEYKTYKKEKKEEKGALGKVVDKLKGGKQEQKQEEPEKKIRTKDKLKAKKAEEKAKEEKKEQEKKEQEKKEIENKEEKKKQETPKKETTEPKKPEVKKQ